MLAGPPPSCGRLPAPGPRHSTAVHAPCRPRLQEMLARCYPSHGQRCSHTRAAGAPPGVPRRLDGASGVASRRPAPKRAGAAKATSRVPLVPDAAHDTGSRRPRPVPTHKRDALGRRQPARPPPCPPLPTRGRRRRASDGAGSSRRTCYLVDPASSHMLVSKIKPCMCKYELIRTVKLRMAH